MTRVPLHSTTSCLPPSVPSLPNFIELLPCESPPPRATRHIPLRRQTPPPDKTSRTRPVEKRALNRFSSSTTAFHRSNARAGPGGNSSLCERAGWRWWWRGPSNGGEKTRIEEGGRGNEGEKGRKKGKKVSTREKGGRKGEKGGGESRGSKGGNGERKGGNGGRQEKEREREGESW